MSQRAMNVHQFANALSIFALKVHALVVGYEGIAQTQLGWRKLVSSMAHKEGLVLL